MTNFVSDKEVELSLIQCHSQSRLCKFVFIIVKRATLMDRNLRDAKETLTFLEVKYSSFGELTLCAFAHNPIVVSIGNEYLKECGTKT